MQMCSADVSSDVETPEALSIFIVIIMQLTMYLAFFKLQELGTQHNMSLDDITVSGCAHTFSFWGSDCAVCCKSALGYLC